MYNESLGVCALKGLRDHQNYLARPLALCFAFESSEKQFLAASLLELSFNLDFALARTNEPMLSVIRVKWWIDTIQDISPAPTPLIQNLRVLLSLKPGMIDQLNDLTEQWINVCLCDDRYSLNGWNATWRLLGKMLEVDPEKALTFGNLATCIITPDENMTFTRNCILSLRKNGTGDRSEWLYLLACLGIYQIQRKGLPFNNLEAFLLGWRILLWRLGFFPQLG